MSQAAAARRAARAWLWNAGARTPARPHVCAHRRRGWGWKWKDFLRIFWNSLWDFSDFGDSFFVFLTDVLGMWMLFAVSLWWILAGCMGGLWFLIVAFRRISCILRYVVFCHYHWCVENCVYKLLGIVGVIFLFVMIYVCVWLFVFLDVSCFDCFPAKSAGCVRLCLGIDWKIYVLWRTLFGRFWNDWYMLILCFLLAADRAKLKKTS